MQRYDAGAEIAAKSLSCAMSLSRAKTDRPADSAVLWSAIRTERRATMERTMPGAARCGWYDERKG